MHIRYRPASATRPLFVVIYEYYIYGFSNSHANTWLIYHSVQGMYVAYTTHMYSMPGRCICVKALLGFLAFRSGHCCIYMYYICIRMESRSGIVHKAVEASRPRHSLSQASLTSIRSHDHLDSLPDCDHSIYCFWIPSGERTSFKYFAFFQSTKRRALQQTLQVRTELMAFDLYNI
jgi:hypothetical protein